MNRDKQIEEMAKDLGIAFQLAGTTYFGAVAEVLVNAGYRKAPEVAKEIFKDIDHMLSMMFEEYASLGHKEYSAVIEGIYRKLKILEKKYTEEEKWK